MNESENIKDLEPTTITKPVKKVSKFKGFIFVMISAGFNTFQNYFMRKAYFFNGSEQTVFRYLFQLVLMIIMARYYKLNLLGPKGIRIQLVVRGILGASGLLLLNISIKLIDPSDSIALFFSNVIIISILARFIFKEKFTIAHIIALIAMVFGILLISQPSFLKPNSNQIFNETFDNISAKNKFKSSQTSSFLYIFGVVSAIAAAFFASGVAIMLKKLTNLKIHHSIIILFAAYVGLPFSLAVSVGLILTGNETKQDIHLNDYYFLGVQTLFACLSALMGCAHQLSINLAYKYEDASKISIYRTCDLIFTFLMQYFFLNITSNLFSIIGSVLIVFGNLLVLGFKMIDSKPSTDKEVTSPESDRFVNKPLDDESKSSFLNSLKRIVFIKF